MINRQFDAATGIIRVVGTGIWSFTDIEHHYSALRDLIADLRARGLPVRLLSDVTHGQRQASWVEDYILEQMRMTFSPEDRIALLAGSDTDRSYLADRLDDLQVATFSCRVAAEQWLLRPASELAAG